ncbi:hypothetical protein AKJ61_02550 [candidate division MSBL1 archaeon SCGC-AAA259B11]|uniref:Sulfur carrier protein FdhD n=2 Tax=candidate division MSBL1 TaxID=215777 RepID=A0A133U5Z0_9EURY|nr:hypothetical protein AKJ61_02550 [candidate division MSBL1 archaeon SCGC-AAA259B11]
MGEKNDRANNKTDEIKKFDYEKITRDGRKKGVEFVAVEESYDLIVNGMRISSIMASPNDLKELIYGYLVSEGIVKSKDQISSVEVKDNKLYAFIEGSEKIEQWLELRSSGCVGVHWGDSEEEVSIESEFKIGSDLIFKALEHLNTNLYKKTSGSHSASLIDEQGKILAKSVDVGRHNAFDKVIGKGLLKGIDMSRTILLASGRQSAGMVMKAARAGIPIIVSKAAPLSSGIEAAKRTNLTLICFADEKKFSVFTGGQNIEN